MPIRRAQLLTRELVAELVRALPVGRTRRLWDAGVGGLCLEARAGSARAFWRFWYRDPSGRQRSLTVGDASLPLADARKQALVLAGDVARGGDPLEARRAARVAGMTVADAWEAYRAHKAPVWKPRTAALFEYLAVTKLLPGLGREPMARLTAGVVERWHRRLTGDSGPVVANRALALLSSTCNHWIAREAPDRPNPCRGVARNREARRERYLSLEEVVRLWLAVEQLEALGPRAAVPRVGVSQGRGGRGMREAEPRGITPHQGALIKLLLLTGARLSEVRDLAWERVRLDEAVLLLTDSKTGARRVLVPSAGLELLVRLRPRPSGPVIAGRDATRGLNDIRKAWRRACRLAGIEGATPHCLRHTCATLMAAVGAPILSISTVLGHAISSANATAVYLHAATEAEARVWLERSVARVLEAVEGERARRAGGGQ